MSNRDYMRFIENPDFPIDDINEASAKEKLGGGRPPYWEMVFWWTRKPHAGARAVIAGALLPSDTNLYEFRHNLRLTRKITHKENPHVPPTWKEIFSKTKLLDPFAGFGSIPLEAIRLGINEVVAVELLPTAYIFLKAVLEYPKWAIEHRLGQKLIKDVERWGNWVAEKLREDPDIKELYDEDVAVYIGTWEVKCPHCKKWTPLVGNWWLARVSTGSSEEEGEEEEGEEATKSGVFKRLAWMEPIKTGDNIVVKVVDLKRELDSKTLRAKVNSKQGIVVIGDKKYHVPQKNIDARRETATCLHCNNQIRKGMKDWYIREAIRDWNQKLEQYLARQIDLKTLIETTKARPRILVKVKTTSGDLEFEPAIQEDQEELWRALEKLKQIWGDPDIPTEQLWPYISSEGGRLSIITWGFDKFYKLFNPRQLLTLVKLVKLIREAGKKIEEERLKEGWSREDAFKYAEAVTTYLAIALARYAGYSNITTPWKNYTGFGSATALLRAVNIMVFRGIAMAWNWTDYNIAYSGIGFERDINSIISSLSYLVSTVSGSPSRVRVVLNDATTLSKLSDEKFDVIVTDPPYRDDVPYAELSDFYYVWLRRALSDDGLSPRFYSDALIYNTQWESFAINEISYNEDRFKYFGVEETEDYYERLMGMAFKRMNELLKDDGLLITYFAHSCPQAWIELIEAGWKKANLRVTKAWNIATESAQRVTARGKTALESSIVVVWRKRRGDKKVGDYKDVYDEALESARKSKETALKSGLMESDLFLATMIGALSVFTSYDKVLRFGKELTSRDIVRESYAIATRVVANATDAIRSPEALFYLASKAIYRVYAKLEGQLTLEGILAEPIILSSQDVIILSYGFLKEDVEKKGKGGAKLFEKAGIIRNVENVKGAKVAQQKAFMLLEPLEPSLKGIKEVLGIRNVNPIRLEANNRSIHSIDILHLLEYYAKQGRGEFNRAYQMLYNKYPKLVREAIEIARVIKNFANDPERFLAKLCVEFVEGR